MTDVPKRGRSATRTPAISGRDETPEFPLEGSMLISDIANIANKKAKRSGPQKLMRNHYREILTTFVQGGISFCPSPNGDRRNNNLASDKTWKRS